MLMRHTKAYDSSCSQLISVYLHPFRRTSLFCSQKLHKITKILYFLGSRSCQVIDADTVNKHVSTACYDNIAKFCKKNHVIQCHLTLLPLRQGTCNFKPSYKI